MRLQLGLRAPIMVLLVTLAAASTGCIALLAGDKPTRTSASMLTGKRWLLETLDGTSVPVDTESTLAFDSATAISGQGGCDRFSASVGILDGEFLAGPITVSGEATCRSEVRALQARYFAALTEARRFEAGDLYLLLFDAEGRQRLGLSVIVAPSP